MTSNCLSTQGRLLRSTTLKSRPLGTARSSHPEPHHRLFVSLLFSSKKKCTCSISHFCCPPALESLSVCMQCRRKSVCALDCVSWYTQRVDKVVSWIGQGRYFFVGLLLRRSFSPGHMCYLELDVALTYHMIKGVSHHTLAFGGAGGAAAVVHLARRGLCAIPCSCFLVVVIHFMTSSACYPFFIFVSCGWRSILCCARQCLS